MMSYNGTEILANGKNASTAGAQWSDVIATNVGQGDDLLSNIFGQLQNIGPAIQRVSNDWAMLQAQNDDVANSRWTLNNLAAQWTAMPRESQMMLVAALVGTAYFLRKD